MAQFRLVDVAKRQLKTPPDARDVSRSIRKREILAKHKIRFATNPDEKEMAYYNLKRKHVIGFDRLASRLPTRGIGAHQNDNDIINRLVYRTATHRMMLGPNTKELQKESNIPVAFNNSPVARTYGRETGPIEPLEEEAENADDYFAEQSAALAGSFAQSSPTTPKLKTYTEEQREAIDWGGVGVAARFDTDRGNTTTTLRYSSYPREGRPSSRLKGSPESKGKSVKFRR